jgi:hypothetical protein
MIRPFWGFDSNILIDVSLIKDGYEMNLQRPRELRFFILQYLLN